MQPVVTPRIVPEQMWVGGIPPHMTDKERMLAILQLHGLPPITAFYFRVPNLDTYVLVRTTAGF
jgi:hypothetical protein